MKERYILHCDCNSFFASVELLSFPELKNKPVAVGGDSESRHGIVLAKNDVAKKYGVKTAETLWQAKEKCPDLIILPPHHSRYTQYSKTLNNIYTQYSDLVEPFGIDESWIDITNTYKLFANSPKELADIIRNRVKDETGLTISVGVSFNKIFAKLGSDYKKPDATTVIDKDNFKNIVWSLPVESMIYIGKRTQNSLNELGIYTIGELAKSEEKLLHQRLGKHGIELYQYANGLDNSPVSSFYDKKEIKSVGSGNTFSHNLSLIEEIKPALLSLSEDVGTRLRKQKLFANGVQLTIRYPDFYTFTRQVQIKSTDITQDIYKTALKLFNNHWNREKPIRALTVTAIDLEKEKRAEQLSLFEIEKSSNQDKNEKLQHTIDCIRDKYGIKYLQNATILTGKEIKKPKNNPFGNKPE